MDDLSPGQIIILTGIVNLITTGLLGGIVIYVIQRRIDASIQRSLFESQTKFARIHEKRALALEDLYRKLRKYYDAMGSWVMDTLVAQAKPDRVAQAQRSETLFGLLRDFEVALDEARPVLSADIIREVEEIRKKAEYWHSHLAILLLDNQTGFMSTDGIYKIHRLVDELEQLYKSVADTG